MRRFHLWVKQLFHRPARPARRLGLLALEDRLTPATAFAVGIASVAEPLPGGTATLNFPVTRSGDVGAAVTLGYTTVAGTAAANTDFTPTTGTVRFAANQTAATIGVPVIGNGQVNNPSLTFSLKLTGATTDTGLPVALTAQTPLGVGASSSLWPSATSTPTGRTTSSPWAATPPSSC